MDEVLPIVEQLLGDHGDVMNDRHDFLAARFDAGLAWVNHPHGLGGRAWPRAFQPLVDGLLRAAGAPDNAHREPDVGLGIAAPTIASYVDPALAAPWLRRLFIGEELWCQLFSEPEAGSDLASVRTRAVRTDEGWAVSGHKIWTSNAYNARWGILLARTDTSVAKHRGLTYFVCDMHQPGVTVRPLRLLTGEAEFSEVFLENVNVPDAYRVGEVGEGWAVARSTLSNERLVIGSSSEEEFPLASRVVDQWNVHGNARSADLRSRITRLWIDAQAYTWIARITAAQGAEGDPGPEASGMKLAFARLSQALSGAEVELAGHRGLEYEDWTMKLSSHADLVGSTPAYRYLRSRGNSIEGGTSEIMLNVIAERVLGLPREPVAVDEAWRPLS